MGTLDIHSIFVFIQRSISFVGIVIILSGALRALYQYVKYFVAVKTQVSEEATINSIRLNLGRILVLGLEFIVAADLISTTTTPDYYSVGIVACIVAIRTVLSYTLNKELIALSPEK